jgi:hypothetical protein
LVKDIKFYILKVDKWIKNKTKSIYKQERKGKGEYTPINAEEVKVAFRSYIW